MVEHVLAGKHRAASAWKPVRSPTLTHKSKSMEDVLAIPRSSYKMEEEAMDSFMQENSRGSRPRLVMRQASDLRHKLVLMKKMKSADERKNQIKAFFQQEHIYMNQKFEEEARRRAEEESDSKYNTGSDVKEDGSPNHQDTSLREEEQSPDETKEGSPSMNETRAQEMLNKAIQEWEDYAGEKGKKLPTLRGKYSRELEATVQLWERELNNT
ncbi:hypothetical protein PROFUN_08382 [Planoprotostelium fungivorum]|uniref:Uncharacterized protein n=1 Tax=Planoprotostelium fungivorum TaxID=1890364 RepID=A0A2P6NJR7_9EUKA|nr:hypothetical protein PROFUN_08382 [Planoprotostelium fungivorum]